MQAISSSRWGNYSHTRYRVQKELNRLGIPVVPDPVAVSYILAYPQWMQRNLMAVFQ